MKMPIQTGAFALLLGLCGCGTGAPPPPASKVEPAAKPKVATEPAFDVGKLVELTLPAGWHTHGTRPKRQVMEIRGPDEVRIFVSLRPEAGLAVAIAKAWKQARADFAIEPREVVKLPSAKDPFEAASLASYRVEAGQIFRQALAQRHQGRTYVLMLEAPLAAVKKRAAQLSEIFGSLRPRGVAKKKLSSSDAVKLGDEQLAALKGFIERARDELSIPGVAFALAQDGRAVLELAAGYTDLTKKRPMTVRTQMMIGSITKSFTAMLLARLVAEKRFAWDTPVTEVYPQFRLKSAEKTAAIQMQHLLCACTGVPRRDMPLLFEWEKATPATVLRDLRDYELLTGFGETFQYSNQLVAVAGFIAGKVGARRGSLAARYRKLLRKKVLDPLGMRDTQLDFAAVLRKRRHALPHSETIRGEVRTMPVSHERFVLPYAPAGALWTTAEDFTRLLEALTSTADAKRAGLLPRAALAELWRPRVKASADASYGLGWLTQLYKGTPVHGHGGGTLGFVSYFAYVPAARAAFVILTNGSRGGALRSVLVGKLMAMLFGQPDTSDKKLAFVRERIEQKLAKIGEDLAPRVPPARREQLVGDYDGGELGRVRIRSEGERAILDTGPFEMGFLPRKKAPHPETYVLVDPPLTGIAFWVEQKDGKPQLQLEPNNVRYTLRKVK